MTALKVLLVGFVDFGRSEVTEGVFSVGWTERIDDDASIVAISLDSFTDDVLANNNLRIDLNKAFKRGARIILCLGPDVAGALDRGAGSWLQAKLGTKIGLGGPWAIRSLVDSLDRWFQEHLAHALVGWRDDLEPPGVRVLGEALNNQGDVQAACAVGFTHGDADVMVIPVAHRNLADRSVLSFLEVAPSREEYPDYLDALPIRDEESVRDRLVEIEKETQELEARLKEAHRVKQILYFSEFDLQEEVVRFLDQYLHIGARLTGGTGRDDFRLVEADDWCIGEVKGSGKGNVTRPDVGALVFHRQEAGFSETFPALLVGNTFHRKKSLPERDQPVSDSVYNIADDQHVLIVRTLDLVRNYQAEAGEALLEAVRTGGGWFEVDMNLQHRVHRRKR